jgi:hypothetical protein
MSLLLLCGTDRFFFFFSLLSLLFVTVRRVAGSKEVQSLKLTRETVKKLTKMAKMQSSRYTAALGPPLDTQKGPKH